MSGGGATGGNYHQKGTSCTSSIGFGRRFMTLQPPLLFLHVSPPFPAESQGADSWDIFFKPWPAGETMTAAFRTSKSKVCEAVMRSFGFG